MLCMERNKIPASSDKLAHVEYQQKGITYALNPTSSIVLDVPLTCQLGIVTVPSLHNTECHMSKVAEPRPALAVNPPKQTLSHQLHRFQIFYQFRPYSEGAVKN